MERDLGDIIDRWSIAKLKKERIGTSENKKEFDAFNLAIIELKEKDKSFEWDKFCNLMLSVNDFIWQLEAGLKSGKEELPNSHYILDKLNDKILSKIGLTTIIIRNFNSLRVQIKNLINKIVNSGFQDIKKGHLSE